MDPHEKGQGASLDEGIHVGVSAVALVGAARAIRHNGKSVAHGRGGRKLARDKRKERTCDGVAVVGDERQEFDIEVDNGFRVVGVGHVRRKDGGRAAMAAQKRAARSKSPVWGVIVEKSQTLYMKKTQGCDKEKKRGPEWKRDWTIRVGKKENVGPDSDSRKRATADLVDGTTKGTRKQEQTVRKKKRFC